MLTQGIFQMRQCHSFYLVKYKSFWGILFKLDNTTASVLGNVGNWDKCSSPSCPISLRLDKSSVSSDGHAVVREWSIRRHWFREVQDFTSGLMLQFETTIMHMLVLLGIESIICWNRTLVDLNPLCTVCKWPFGKVVRPKFHFQIPNWRPSMTYL